MEYARGPVKSSLTVKLKRDFVGCGSGGISTIFIIRVLSFLFS